MPQLSELGLVSLNRFFGISDASPCVFRIIAKKKTSRHHQMAITKTRLKGACRDGQLFSACTCTLEHLSVLISDGCLGLISIYFSFFLGFGLYFGLGALYNSRTYNARGWDLLPHSDFWRDLPYLIKVSHGILCAF